MYEHPHTIENGAGEQITFIRLISESDGDRLELENLVQPGAGPPMHVHFKQDEHLEVLQGRMGIQVHGEEPSELGVGGAATFKAGVAHRFWCASDEPLICKGWIKPANNVEYFLTEIYQSTKNSGAGRPGAFDSAYLLHKYRSEFDMLEIPTFVRKVIFPLTRTIGILRGEHKKFSEGPDAL